MLQCLRVKTYMLMFFVEFSESCIPRSIPRLTLELDIEFLDSRSPDER